MIRTFLSYVAPQLILTRHSTINGTIRIEQFLGKKRVMVGGYIQSGDYARVVFERGMQGTTIDPSNVLVLGVGGGTMIGEVLKRWLSSAVTAVDIDPVMIDIAKNYFGLSSKRIRFVVSNAVMFVKNNTKRFDLIIDDLFVGCDRPKEADSRSYYHSISQCLSTSGLYLCNRSYLPSYKQRTDKAISIIQSIFPNTETILKYPNMLIRRYTLTP